MLEVVVPRGAGVRRFVLRELRGSDELALPERAPSTRIAASVLADLVGSLVVRERSSCGFEDASVAERDRVYAAIARATFGDRVEARATCDGCGERYELTFALSALEAARPLVSSDVGDIAVRTVEQVFGDFVGVGVARVGDTAVRVRPPTVGELARWGDDALSRFREACVVGDASDEAIDRALEEGAPLLDASLDAPCPACGRARRERFEIGAWLFSGLLRERRVALRELHVLARAYGWSLESLLGLTRSQRHAFVRLVTRTEART